ncbi:hypothetical protein J6590_075593 [Homalodisca vitripennis]|nr:hypothetical protein J6590_075593 [Homalodisca vitripennis]
MNQWPVRSGSTHQQSERCNVHPQCHSSLLTPTKLEMSRRPHSTATAVYIDAASRSTRVSSLVSGVHPTRHLPDTGSSSAEVSVRHNVSRNSRTTLRMDSVIPAECLHHDSCMLTKTSYKKNSADTVDTRDIYCI